MMPKTSFFDHIYHYTFQQAPATAHSSLPPPPPPAARSIPSGTSCYICHSTTHWADTCPDKKKGYNGFNKFNGLPK
eukprot:1141371-Pelagomonas_calceolata.AAC.2